MFNKIKQVFEKYDIKINYSQIESFEKFYTEMIKFNEHTNLTAIIEERDVLYKHFLDSIIPEKLIKKNTNIIDIGCGAGFPSIPLKIIRPDLNFTAVDSTKKKTEFVELVKNQLNLENFNVIHTRIEDLARKKEYRESFDMVISRAVANLSTLLEYSAPLVKNNGTILCYKGHTVLEELKSAENCLKILDLEVTNVHEIEISEINAKRYIVEIKKKSTIPNKYPRKLNHPRTKPL